jgi:hypothetical protein
LCAIASCDLLHGEVITGFDNSQWSLNSAIFHLNGGSGNVPAATGLAILDPNTLKLNAAGSDTVNVGDAVNSAWYKTKVSVSSFQVSFTWKVTAFYGYGANFGPADGFTFVFQNQGLDAAGGFGYGLGYFDNGTPGITKSAGLEFRTYGAGTGYVENAGLVTYGGNLGAGSAVNLDELNHPIDVAITYDGSTLTEALKDTITGGTFSTCYRANIAAAVGDSTAYVGFTGGTGNGTMDDFITNFQYSSSGPTSTPPCPEPPPPQPPCTDPSCPEPGSYTLASGVLLAGLGLARRLFVKR